VHGAGSLSHPDTLGEVTEHVWIVLDQSWGANEATWQSALDRLDFESPGWRRLAFDGTLAAASSSGWTTVL
jgi:hypothetical protein